MEMVKSYQTCCYFEHLFDVFYRLFMTNTLKKVVHHNLLSGVKTINYNGGCAGTNFKRLSMS
jgi:hypothetical protein